MRSKKTTQVTQSRPNRLLSLDILRGITIAGMILVNNPGSWGHIYAPLEHASWNGLTPTDLVFPFFMFIMGISTYFSLRKYDFKFSWPTLRKICRRTVVIFLIGIAIAWLSLFLRRMISGETLADSVLNFGNLRLLGVMPRLALCYGVGSILAITLKQRGIKWAIATMLVVYALLLLFGYGYEFSDRNIISIIDHKVLGADHMYTDVVDGVKLTFDPEGLLSTIPSIAHMLIGFLCGAMIVATKDNYMRVNKLFIVGTILTFAGFLLSYGLPINKKIWSPTFVLTTCGLAASLLALLIWIIDIRGHKTWCRFFEAFGINPLFMYVLGAVLSIVIGSVRFTYHGIGANAEGIITLKGWIYNALLIPACSGNETLASLFFAILFVACNWVVGYVLYKKKIYIKI